MSLVASSVRVMNFVTAHRCVMWLAETNQNHVRASHVRDGTKTKRSEATATEDHTPHQTRPDALFRFLPVGALPSLAHLRVTGGQTAPNGPATQHAGCHRPYVCLFVSSPCCCASSCFFRKYMCKLRSSFMCRFAVRTYACTIVPTCRRETGRTWRGTTRRGWAR